MFLIYLFIYGRCVKRHILGLRKGQKIITLEIFAYWPDPNPVASPVVPASTPILKPPPLPRRGKKRTIEAVLKEAEETTCLQRETNQILGELVSEMRQARSDLNSRLDQLINLKKLKLELLQEGIELKRKKLNIN
jgi:hypothetical protein